MNNRNQPTAGPESEVIRLNAIPLSLDKEPAALRGIAVDRLGLRDEQVDRVVIVRRSIDARNKRDMKFVYAVDVHLNEACSIPEGALDAALVLPEEPVETPPGTEELHGRPLVVGAGPCGLFAALVLAENGYRPILLERGNPVHKRVKDVRALFDTGLLDPESNVLFGEGGAGTFSDGKLYTRTRSRHVNKVLGTLIECGAPDDIAWNASPHIGSDLLPEVIAGFHERLTDLGCDFRTSTRLEAVYYADGRLAGLAAVGERIETNAAVLAVGHSARDVFLMLRDGGVKLEAKPYQMGVRAELPQSMVDEAVYGCTSRHPKLPPATFRLTARKTGSVRAAFTFCMCPGGMVVPAMDATATLCTNGMSRRAQDAPLANSAVVVPVGHSDFAGDDPLAGMELQLQFERAGFELGGGDMAAPAQTAGDYLEGRASREGIDSSYPLGLRPAQLVECLPPPVAEAIAHGLKTFGRRIPGFTSEKCLLLGPETRCSSPVRIVRNRQTCESETVEGLYPAGEGAGYAGGIMSSAADGIRCAEALISKFARPRG